MGAGQGAQAYRAAPVATLRIEPLDPVLTAVFHRASGVTHLLAEPAPEMLAALAGDALTQGELLARLRERFDLTPADPLALSARLAELVAAGLVEALPA